MNKFVKIKTWHAMKAEFGIRSTGSIDCALGFPKAMEDKMHANRIIEITPLPIVDGEYEWIDHPEYTITDDMIDRDVTENEQMKINFGIRAEVMFEWDRDKNTNCRFIPGEKARVCNRHIDRNSKVCNSYIGEEGTIVAVTTGGDGLIRSYSRMYTKYYVQFNDDNVQGYLSGDLDDVEVITSTSQGLVVGDICNITDLGLCYSSYTEMAIAFKLTNYYGNSICSNNCSKQEEYEIIGIKDHLNSPRNLLVALRSKNGMEYIIEQNGIIKYRIPDIEIDDLKEQIKVLTKKLEDIENICKK